MILLRRLECRRFRQLREVSLRFPESGSMLIEGPNESGKSSLLEAVFFALFGRTLIPDRDYTIQDLKSYGAEEMRVELELSVGDRVLVVTRRVGSAQTAALRCPGGPAPGTLGGGSAEEALGETLITGARAVNERLREELRLTPEALLDTCFVEQKRLDRLESQDARERLETLNTLLNLDALTALEKELRVTAGDRQELERREGRAEVARLDAELPEAERQYEEARRQALAHDARSLAARAAKEREAAGRLPDLEAREKRLKEALEWARRRGSAQEAIRREEGEAAQASALLSDCDRALAAAREREESASRAARSRSRRAAAAWLLAVALAAAAAAGAALGYPVPAAAALLAALPAVLAATRLQRAASAAKAEEADAVRERAERSGTADHAKNRLRESQDRLESLRRETRAAEAALQQLAPGLGESEREIAEALDALRREAAEARTARERLEELEREWRARRQDYHLALEETDAGALQEPVDPISETAPPPGRVEETRDRLRQLEAKRELLASRLGLGPEPLALAVELEAADSLRQDLEVRARAGQIVAATRQSLVSRILPLTLHNTRRLLPLLTEGRYQDVQWDEERNLLLVYDSKARAFQRKRVFSGGARDQISLALRLAFAIATLPGEHGARPGWLVLDEPLSSFDRQRTQALVDLVTRGLVRSLFPQVFLVSHSDSFDPSLFDHRLRLEAGEVVESTLPA